MEWFQIPGFMSYDININTRQVRSHKHPYGNMRYHIMKVYDDGTVRLVDDYGKRKSVSPSFLYDQTFNSDNELVNRDNELWLGAMNPLSKRQSSNIDIINGTYKPLPEKKQEYVTIDFTKYSNKKTTKPFTINP